MRLEKIQLCGFKSFCKKTCLEFPEAGQRKKTIACIIGPNGSGKSNILDALRWALGEQSHKSIRLHAGEDIIFQGSDHLSRSGFAEVVLTFQNEKHGDHSLPGTLEITRRLFRNGVSEYFLNKVPAKLSDILLLLAKAHIGQKSFSIISQGKIESIMTATPQERKLFFEDAFGVRHFQLERNASISKLSRSKDHLKAATNILSEITPRLDILFRQVKKFERKNRYESDLSEFQKAYHHLRRKKIVESMESRKEKITLLKSAENGAQQSLDDIKKAMTLISEKNTVSKKFFELQLVYEDLQKKKSEFLKEKALLDARFESSLASQGKLNLVYLRRRSEQIASDLAHLEKEIRLLGEQQKECMQKEETLAKTMDSLTKRLTSRQAALETRLMENQKSMQVASLAPAKKEMSEIIDSYRRSCERLSAVHSRDEVLAISGEFKKIYRELQSWYEKYSFEGTNVSISLDTILFKNEIAETNRHIHEAMQKMQRSKTEKAILDEKLKLAFLRKREFEDEREKIRQDSSAFEKVNVRIPDQIDMAAKNPINDENQRRQNIIDGLKTIDDEMGALNRNIRSLQAEERKNREKLFSHEKHAQSLEKSIHETSRQRTAEEIEMAKDELLLQQAVEHGQKLFSDERLYTDPANIRSELLEISEEKLSSKIESLQKAVNDIGAIDAETVREYENTKKKQDALRSQMDDISASIRSMEKLIAELDATIHDRFETSFRAVNEVFSSSFAILFGGGMAKLVKTQTSSPADPSHAADAIRADESAPSVKSSRNIDECIDIVVCPPGKKLRHSDLLSGGEKSLCAFALISAIITVSKTPFVMFDEVDAALDEANSAKIAAVLRQLSQTTQCILLTHNRTIMNVADMIYGVSMGNDGVSKLLSVKFDDIADRAAILMPSQGYFDPHMTEFDKFMRKS
ncbi:MAG: AAA family ATPase [Parcubacteria group bacterium]|nr:AAA family ATPase [Parcubacteria group bacterium]